MDVKRICQYIQGTKGNSVLFNLPKKLVVDFYSDADFRDFVDMKTTKALFVLVIELDLW